MKSVLVFLLLLILLAAVVFTVVSYIVGSAPGEAPEEFVVLYDGKELDKAPPLAASGSEPLVFEVLGSDEYTVKVVPCETARVFYTVAGVPQSLQSIEDLTDCFRITREDHFLTVAPGGSLEQMLIHHYGGVQIALSEETDLDQDFFSLLISCGEIEYSVNFGLYTYTVVGVTLPERLVF